MTNDKEVSREDAIGALREFRLARQLIDRTEKRAIERLSEAHSIDDLKLDGEERGDYELAKEHLLRSLRLNPYFPPVHMQLANAYRELDDNADLQLQFYNSCLELDPDDDDVVVARMGLHLESHRLPEASEDLKRLRELKSDHAEPMAMHLAQLSRRR